MAVAEAVAVTITGLHTSFSTNDVVHTQTDMHTDPFSRSYKRTGRPT